MNWVGNDTLEARFPIQKDGIYVGAIDVGHDKVLPLAPLSLPYSPEFEPRQDPAEGQKLLAQIAHITGGVERTSWSDVFTSTSVHSRQVRDLVIPFAMALLLLHVFEIAGRRMLFFAALNSRLQRMRLPNLRRTRKKPASTIPKPRQTPVEPQPVPQATTSNPLARAKAKARNRTESE
jgi:hypothetical protein